MKIRSVLLGSLAAAGLATTGYAADLGVVTSLDVCDELGQTGLMISSDDNCLVISGGVTMEYQLGDFNPAQSITVFDIDNENGPLTVADADGTLDSKVDIDVWLKFVATASSDFGPATATIKLLREDYAGTGDFTFLIDEAWVGVGDTTMLMAGKKGSIFKDGDDVPLNYLGLFVSEKVDTGVGFSKAVDLNADGDTLDAGEQGGAGAKTGGVVIQVVSDLGNGIQIGGGIENLQTSAALTPAPITAVGVLSYAGEGVTAHINGAIDQNSDWKLHAGFTGAWDPIKVVGAFAANDDVNTGALWWDALGSVSATFDMFTLAVSGEATSGGEWGVGGSVAAAVTEDVTINLGSRYFDDTNGTENAWQTEAGVSAKVTETITLTAAAGAIDGDLSPTIFYGKAGLAWAPGGGFTSSIEGYANSDGGYKGTFKAAKTIK